MPNFPELAEIGAFSPMERYSLNDVLEIDAFARSRGVRVIPEFDMPGHSTALCKSHPEICDKSGDTYNPVLDATYDFLDKYISDIASYFKDKILHLGGDEVPTAQWSSDPSINKTMTERNWTV